MFGEISEDLKENFVNTHKALDRELAKLRTGRANASLLDSIRVDYYGSPTPLNQVATIKIPEPRTITITPWEKSMLKLIERALFLSSLGVTPQNDGKLIRLSFPSLTGEVRQKIAKQARQLGENAKISLRAARRDANEMIKDLQKEGEISEDMMHTHLETIQNLTIKHNKKVEKTIKKKETEIHEI